MEKLKGDVTAVSVRELRRLLKTLLEAGEPVLVRQGSRNSAVLLPLKFKSHKWSGLERGERTLLKDSLAQVFCALGE